MTARWLDRPPTAGEVRAHAEAHPCPPSVGPQVCCWLVAIPGGPPCIAEAWLDEAGRVMVDIEDERVCPGDYAAMTYPEARWRPLTADGDDAPLPLTAEGPPVDTPINRGEVRRVCNDCDEEVQPDNSCGCPSEIPGMGPLVVPDGRHREYRRIAKLYGGATAASAAYAGTEIDEPEAPTLEQRLFAARQASGLPLCALISGALTWYYRYPAPIAHVSDETLIRVVEDWVREHPRGEGR